MAKKLPRTEAAGALAGELARLKTAHPDRGEHRGNSRAVQTRRALKPSISSMGLNNGRFVLVEARSPSREAEMP